MYSSIARRAISDLASSSLDASASRYAFCGSLKEMEVRGFFDRAMR